MEKSIIPILENFAIISVIMPYYGKTDKAFLLLSSLYSGSRNKIDEFYEEFRQAMKDYCLCTKIVSCNARRLFLPNDLFAFSIEISTEELMKLFIEYVCSLKARVGYYFRIHYMSGQITIYDFTVNLNLIKYLNDHIETLRSIQISTKLSTNKNCDCSTNQTLLDKIYINYIYPGCTSKELSKVYFGKNSKVMSKYESFKKINTIYYESLIHEECLQELNRIKDNEISIGTLYIHGESEEELENLTNPDLYHECNNISYLFDELHPVKSNIFKNINKIKPERIAFDTNYKIDGFNDIIMFDFVNSVSILKNVKCLNVFNNCVLPNCSFVFSNALIKICRNSLKETEIDEIKEVGEVEFVILKCKRLLIELDSNKTIFKISSKHTNESCKNSFFHFKAYKSVSLNMFEAICESGEISINDKIFPDCQFKKEIGCEFIVSLESLFSVEIFRNLSSVYRIFKDSNELMHYIKLTKKVICDIEVDSEIKFLNKLLALLPVHTNYVLNKTQNKNTESIIKWLKAYICNYHIDQASMIRISEINIYTLQESNYELINCILSFPTTPIYLDKVNLVLPTLSEAIKTLDLLSNCCNINRVFIKYKTADTGDEKESIESSLNHFHKKVGFNEIIKISKMI